MESAYLDGFAALLCFQHLVSAGVEDFAHQRTHRIFIFHEQHRLGATRRKLRGCSSWVSVCAMVARRKIDLEACTAANFTFHADVSATLLHYAVHGGQAEPRALPFFFRG